MLLILGTIGMGAVAGCALSGVGSSRRDLLMSLVGLAAITMEVRLINHETSIIIISAAMVATFFLRLLILSLLRVRETARP